MMLRTYWQASRAPRYSLLFALPLLIIYQILAALAPPGPGGVGVRNGADVVLESVFMWLAGVWGPRLFMVCLIAVGAWIIAKDARTNRGPLSPAVIGGMLAESICLALVFGIVLGLDRPQRTLHELALAAVDLDPEKLRGFVIKHGSGLHVVPAPLRPARQW